MQTVYPHPSLLVVDHPLSPKLRNTWAFKGHVSPHLSPSALGRRLEWLEICIRITIKFIFFTDERNAIIQPKNKA